VLAARGQRSGNQPAADDKAYLEADEARAALASQYAERL
jgi:hypothetical protein